MYHRTQGEILLTAWDKVKLLKMHLLVGNEFILHSMHNRIDNFLTDGDGLFSAKSTELLPNSQEGRKKVQSVHSSANQQQKEQSVGPSGFGDGEDENLPGMFILNSMDNNVSIL